MRRLIRCLALSAAVFALPPVGYAAEPFVETEGPRPWYSMLRPARKTPVEQLAYARGLRDGGSLRRAHRHYRALVASWPSAPEAPVAQLEHARLLEARGRAQDAFAAYQALMEHYPGSFPFDDVFQRQRDIAVRLLDLRRFRLFFGGFAVPERAIPLLEQVAKNAPTRPDAARARWLLGRAHRADGDPAKAAAVFAEIEQQYPDDEIAVSAAFERAECLAERSRRAPGDTRLAEEAWFAFERFARLYPGAGPVPEARAQRDRLHGHLARLAWEQARFYDRRSARPTSAIGPYERFLERFGDTEWAPAARARLDVLRPAPEKEKER